MTTAAAATTWNSAAATPTASAVSARPADSSASGTNGSSTISANDFLTLLVTELQNQDPTSASDPNQYVNQLVSVNSLEQLIQINQTLSTATGQPTGGTSGGTTGQSVSSSAATAAPASGAAPGIGTHQSGSAPSGPPAPLQFGARHFPVAVSGGNLGTPGTNPAAQRVAQALSGRTHI
jgi:flagellar basal-body rod modification protein FlgD